MQDAYILIHSAHHNAAIVALQYTTRRSNSEGRHPRQINNATLQLSVKYSCTMQVSAYHTIRKWPVTIAHTLDDVHPYWNQICRKGLYRNIHTQMSRYFKQTRCRQSEVVTNFQVCQFFFFFWFCPAKHLRPTKEIYAIHLNLFEL